MAPGAQKTVKQGFGGGLRIWRGQEVEDAEQRADRRGHPPGSVEAELVAQARTALQKAVRDVNTVTLLSNIFLNGALVYNFENGLPLPPLNQDTWRYAYQSVSGMAGRKGFDPASQGPFSEFYRLVWRPFWRQLHKKRDIFKQQRDLVDRRSIAGPLGEWARTASAHAVNLLVYNGGVVRRIGIYIYNLLLAAVLAADPDAIQSGRIKLSALERFGIKAAGKITAAAEQAADESDDEFLSRLLSSAIAAKPRGLDLPANVYREWLRSGIAVIMAAFNSLGNDDGQPRLLPLRDGKPRLEVAVDEYLPALLQLRVLIPAIEGARSFEILPRHGIEGRAIQVSQSGLKLIVMGTADTNRKLAKFMRRAGVGACTDMNGWLFRTIFRLPEDEFYGYEPANYADIDLSSIAQHYKRKPAAVYKEHFIALDRKESMLEFKAGSYSRQQPEAPEQDWLLPAGTVRSRGYDPGQRDQGTTGALPRPGTTGRERRLDAEGRPTSVSVSSKEHRSLMNVREADWERKAILQQRPHLLRLEGELRSLQATDLTSCLQKMRMEMHLVLEARDALCSRRFFDLSFLQYGRGQRTHSLETTKYTTSIPTHVRDPAARVVPTRSGETVSPQLYMRQMNMHIGNGRMRPAGASVEHIQRRLADNCGGTSSVDEFRSSKLCPLCHAVMVQPLMRLTDKQRRDLERKCGKKVGKHARVKMYQVWRCPNPTCRTWWQRDVAAAINIDYLGWVQQLEQFWDNGMDLRGKFSRSYKPWEARQLNGAPAANAAAAAGAGAAAAAEAPAGAAAAAEAPAGAAAAAEAPAAGAAAAAEAAAAGVAMDH